MKRLITFLMLCVFSVPAFAATKMYVSTEKVYGFSTENLAETIPEFIEDEKKQNAVADKYTELMDENGNVSVADLFEICRTAGFNTYREAGFQQCSLFMAKLAENAEIELEFTTLSGYCPGVDEKGNNPNGLRSINENTRIGDFCSSTNISAGTVIFRKGYNCTCLSYSCNPGFDLIKGACKEKIADESGNCLAFKATFPDWLPSSIIEDNEQYKDSANNIQEIFENICRGEANKTKGGCKIFGAVPIYSEKYVGCNPPENLIQLYRQGVEAKQNEYSLKDQERQKKLVKGLKYYEVCGKDKGKTGKSEHCVSDFFAKTNVQTTGAIGLAQAYARVKDKREIHCDTNYRTQSNDDYIKCSTMDGTHLYEFKFDDVVERIDSTRETSTMSALCRLVNGTFYPANLNNAGYSTPEICKGITKDVCDTTLRNLGDNLAVFSSWRRYGVSSVAECVMEMKGSKRRLENTLKTIENLDNRAFYNLQVQALEGSYNLIDYMEKYVRKQKPNTISFKCDAGYVSAVTVDGWTAFASDTDDVLRCYVDGKPIDFVFNDLSETFPYQRDAGQEGSVCISMNANTGKPNMIPTNGTYDGHYCRGITRAECEQLQKQVMEELKHHGWHGDDDIVDWDDSADACEINSAQFSRNVNKVATYVAIAGTTILGFFSGGTSWALTASLVSVELAGIAGEIYTDRKKELLPAEWARDFIEQSKNCNDSSCALAVIKGNLNKISQSPGMINPETVTKVDTEMSRLAELMSDAEFEEAVANADELSGWDTWDNQAKIFGFMQMATLGAGVVSGLRGFAKVMGRRLGKAALTKGATKTVTGAVDAATDASKTAKNIGLFNKTTGAPLDRNDILALIKKDAGASYDDIGISVTKNGKLQDLRAAKGKPFISDEAALNRIQENLAKRWDDVDVKVTIGKDGKTYFYDNKAKGFASHETLRTRIGESVGKTTDKATDAAADAGKTASGAGKTAETATGAGKTASGAGKTAESATDAGKTASGAGKTAESATNAGKTANTAEKAKTVVYNAEHFKANPSAADDVFKNADNGIVHINRQNMPASTARDLMKKAKEHGFACSDCGGDVLIFSRTEKATDAGKAASGAGKTAETATGAGKTAGKTAESATDAGKTAGKAAETATDATKNSGKAANITEIRNKVYKDFNKHIENMKNGVETELHVPKRHLSVDEWNTLKQNLKAEGFDITEANQWYFTVKKTDKFTDAAGAGIHDAIDITTLRNKASSNLDAYIKQAKQSKTGLGEAGLPYSRMSESEWKALEKELEKEGIGFTRKGDYMYLQDKTRKAAETATDAGKTAGKAAETATGAGKTASGAGKTAESATDAAADIAKLRNKASSNLDAYIKQAKQSKTGLGEAGLPYSRMSESEWKALEKELEKEGIGFTRKGDYMYLQDKTRKAAETVADAGKGANAGKNLSKAEKIDKARKEGNLGYHGTDADISMDDMIRPSKNTSDALGGVGYGIADSYDAAEGYAIKRLIERQNIGKNIKFTKQGKTLVVESNDALNLSNKTGYVYTTAKDANVQFEGLSNGYVGFFGAAKMPNSVEVLGKSTFNLDDLIKSGRVKIVSKTTDGAASTSKAAKTVDTATDAGKSAGKAANNAGTGKTVYAESIMDKKMYKTKNVTNEDSIWTVTEVSPGSSKYYVDVYEGAHKKILSNPSFLDGAKKQILGRNTLEVVKKGTAHLDDSGKIVLDTPPEVILR